MQPWNLMVEMLPRLLLSPSIFSLWKPLQSLQLLQLHKHICWLYNQVFFYPWWAAVIAQCIVPAGTVLAQCRHNAAANQEWDWSRIWKNTAESLMGQEESWASVSLLLSGEEHKHTAQPSSTPLSIYGTTYINTHTQTSTYKHITSQIMQRFIKITWRP